jgi:hypothetical protein
VDRFIFELAGLVRAALAGWPETVRLCLMLAVIGVTGIAVLLVL